MTTESARLHAARLSQYHRAERFAWTRAALEYRRLERTARREGLHRSDTYAAITWFMRRAFGNARRMRSLERAARREVRAA